MQRDDARLAEGIDCRIGHLGETLSEKRIDGTRGAGEEGERRIVAHRPHEVLAVDGHGVQDHLHVFAGVPEAVLPGEKPLAGGCRFDRGRSELLGLKEIGIGRAGIEDTQQIFILVELAFVQIDGEHLAGAEASALNDGFRVEVDQTSFGSSDNEASVRNGEAAGTQAVAIERGADDVAVRKGDGCRAVPRLNTVGVVAKESR